MQCHERVIIILKKFLPRNLETLYKSTVGSKTRYEFLTITDSENAVY